MENNTIFRIDPDCKDWYSYQEEYENENGEMQLLIHTRPTIITIQRIETHLIVKRIAIATNMNISMNLTPSMVNYEILFYYTD